MKLKLALVLLSAYAGCFLFQREDSSQVRLSIQGNTDLLRHTCSVHITSPGWTKVLTGEDFGALEPPNHSQTLQTPTSGDLQVSIVLTDSLGDHVNSGSIVLDIRPDWIWEIDIVLSNRNPFNGCFGCVGYKALSLNSLYQRTPDDSLFVVWGGNFIKHPVVY